MYALSSRAPAGTKQPFFPGGTLGAESRPFWLEEHEVKAVSGKRSIFPTFFGFFATWWNWALTVICLLRNGAGDRVMTLGDIFNYWFLLLRVGHKAQLECNGLPRDQRFSAVSVLMQYDHLMRGQWKSVAASCRPIEFVQSTRSIDLTLYEQCVRNVKSEGKDESRKRPGTEICRYFQQNGQCKYGTNCKFVHVPGQDKRPRISKDGVKDEPVLRPGPRR